MASAATTTTISSQSRQTPSRSLRKPAATASTPNLNSVYASQSRLTPRAVSRKISLAALNPSALASIPDDSETYSINTVLNDPMPIMAPTTPGKGYAEEAAVGDIVDVPGGMAGTVRFVGSVQGKKGVFAGVELLPEFAAKGKNNGDVDGVSYFNTTAPGAGIFLPIAKAFRRDDGGGRPMYPMTPTPSIGGLKAGNQNSTNFTPPTPSLPKFSASVGPGARAPSPQGKRPRTSLPRPDSPVRRMQMTPGPRPSIATPGPKAPSRYGSPTNNKFAQSVRGTAGDPSKRVPSKLERRPSLGPRSISALGGGFDDDATPLPTKTNGSIGSVSSFNSKIRPSSRANNANDEEVERLRAELEDRNRQLKEQASTLADMESSLTELQTLIEGSDVPPGMGSNGMDDKDSVQLRQMLREKSEKIAMLTAEFDAHRADFRSTIDTLELASTETERVYEKRIEELMGEIRDLESRNLDVDSVATQLKQLEELVQELEEGLEDARRGEAEARGEVEFLRGEVERTRTELRREREKSGASPTAKGEKLVSSKELEQKEDEIRGLKAIIHSLSRDSIPGPDPRTPPKRMSLINTDAVENKIARDNLERQVAELQSILDKKSAKEEEMEQEIKVLRRSSNATQRNSNPIQRSSYRDSRDTVIMAQSQEVRSPEVSKPPTHRRGNTLDTMPESDDYSTATENSTLWCEICETGGHDILTCTNMFGPDGGKANGEAKPARDSQQQQQPLRPLTIPNDDAHPAPLKARTPIQSTPVTVIPNPMESGPVAGKTSGVMDPEKWCAVCERDGHDSVDCPFEDAF